MSKDVRLYKYFLEEIARLGELKRVWFTTFNLNVPFFEKYILSALTEFNPKNIVYPQDYEGINERLAGSESELKEGKIDVRVFYDGRAMHEGDMTKRTGVHLHPIRNEDIRSTLTDKNLNGGVFHPKVVLIETSANQLWLMVSSANLTVGGWARNRESYFSALIEDTQNARNLGLFFEGITSGMREFRQHPLIDRLNRGRIGAPRADWFFFSSFNEGSLPDQISMDGRLMPLRVWSPYFDTDVEAVVDELMKERFSALELIPARAENMQINMSEDSFRRCEERGDVRFLEDKLPVVAVESFVHAKVWLTPDSIAIGSWNLTRSGMNLHTKGRNNVEAGIIARLTSAKYRNILDLYKTVPFKERGFPSLSDIEEQKRDILSTYTLSAELIADWETLKITLQHPTFSKLQKQAGERATVILPGIGRCNLDALERGSSFRSCMTTLLVDRAFEIRDKTDRVLYRGYLRETNLESRPVNSFSNIDDYLRGWVLERPEDRTELHERNIPLNVSEADDLHKHTIDVLTGHVQNNWFTGFHAFECILNRIDATSQKPAKERQQELKNIGRVLPGSLLELRKHLQGLLELYNERPDEFRKSPVYLWFLIEKANHVFGEFNALVSAEDEYITPLRNLRWEHIPGIYTGDEAADQQMNRWKNYLTAKLRAPRS